MEREEVRLHWSDPTQGDAVVAQIGIKGNEGEDRFFVSAIIRFEPSQKTYVRFCSQQCSSWQEVKADVHVNESQQATQKSSLIFVPQGTANMEIKNEKGHENNISVDILYQSLATGGVQESTKLRSCNCDSMTYKSRKQWACPWGEDSTAVPLDYSPLTHIVVHHQAGNAPPPYDAVVRAIWDYHVNANGWSDIGYNWLIAPDGTVYKGRAWINGDENVLGAHTCACNSNKLGICLLGDLTQNGPTAAQYQSLLKFITWKACDLSIIPGITSEVSSRKNGECQTTLVNHIIGHRDGCPPNYTACPGDAFYPMLDQLRTDALNAFNDCSDVLKTEDAEISTYTIVPNPVNESFTIQSNREMEELSIDIYNSLGKLILNKKIQSQEAIETAFQLPPGIYLVKVVGSKKEVIKVMSLVKN